MIERVQLSAGRNNDVKIDWINVGIDQILGMFRLEMNYRQGERRNRTYDLVIGTNARSDTALIICDSETTNVEPSRTLNVIL